MGWDSPRITRYCKGKPPSKTTLISFNKEFGPDLKIPAAPLKAQPGDEPENPEMDQRINDPASDYGLDPLYMLEKLKENYKKTIDDATAGIAVIEVITKIFQGDAEHRVKKGKGK